MSDARYEYRPLVRVGGLRSADEDEVVAWDPVTTNPEEAILSEAYTQVGVERRYVGEWEALPDNVFDRLLRRVRHPGAVR